MTRLHDALDRAAADNAGWASVAGPAAVPRGTGEDIPSAWRFVDTDSAAEIAVPSETLFDDTLRLREPSDPAAAEEQVRARFDASRAAKMVVGRDADSRLVEEFRKLAAVLHHEQRDRGIKSVMVASATGTEGKTLTATNLALTLSHSYQRRVLLVDADLRRPDIHVAFNLPNSTGLGDGLKKRDGRLTVSRILPRLWVLTAGPPDSDPVSGLVSDTMKEVIAEATTRFDWVVLDTPPLALMTDANLLAAMVDCALVVVGAASTPYPLVKRAIDAIGATRVLGLVLNKVEERDMPDAGDYYYGERYQSGKRDARQGQIRLFGRTNR